MGRELLMALLLAIMPAAMPFDYNTSTNIAVVGVPAEYLSGTDQAITELGRMALPITLAGVRVRFADEFGSISPVFDLPTAMALSAGDIFYNQENDR